MSDAIEAALKAYDNAMMNIPMGDCTECGGTGVVITGVGIDAGGSMLVNPTNGSSYTGTVLQSQQIASSRLRAVETGRWLVQVSPTGFSAFVSPNGEVFDRTAVSEQRVVIRDVPQRTGSTLYSQLGDQPIIILLTALVASLLWVARRRRSWSM